VADRTDLSPIAKVLYAMVVDHMDTNGQAWPGYRRLGREAGCHIETVHRAIHDLEAAGLLVVEYRAGKHGCNRYALGVGVRTAQAPAQTEHQRPRKPNTSVRILRSQAPAQAEQTQTYEPDLLNQTQEALTAKAKGVRKTRPPDPVWDAVAATWYPSGIPPSQKGAIGKIVKDFKALGATPEEIAKRKARHESEWPKVTCTPRSLVKHWDQFREGTGESATGRPDLSSNARYEHLFDGG
jgi:hypothetical protein